MKRNGRENTFGSTSRFRELRNYAAKNNISLDKVIDRVKKVMEIERLTDKQTSTCDEEVTTLLAENQRIQQHLDFQIARGNKQAEWLRKMQESGKIIFDDHAPATGTLRQMIPLEKAQSSLEAVTDAALSSIEFMSALGSVQRSLGQLEILTIANGGDKTADAFGECSDLLMASANQFERAIKGIQKNGVENIGLEMIRELLNYCTTLRTAANSYATADPTARPAIQKRIAKTVALTQPIIDRLYQSHKHGGAEMKIVAEMLNTRISKGDHYSDAIKDIRKNDPELCLRVFSLLENDDISEAALAYARQLVSRYKRVEL